jgi:hypothetical protein
MDEPLDRSRVGRANRNQIFAQVSAIRHFVLKGRSDVLLRDNFGTDQQLAQSHIRFDGVPPNRAIPRRWKRSMNPNSAEFVDCTRLIFRDGSFSYGFDSRQ